MEDPTNGQPPAEPSVADALARQMTGQWHGLLQLMTQQGATRLEIMEMAASTSRLVLDVTTTALWPEGAQEPEAEVFVAMMRAAGVLGESLDTIRLMQEREG